MNKVVYTKCQSKMHLQQILELQNKNLAKNIDDQTFKSQGFVTAEHDLQLLSEMNEQQAHVIAIDNDQVVGYALSMTCDFSDRLEVLKPMFDQINSCTYKNQSLKDSSYFVMGQVCIAKDYRSTGVFSQLYKSMRDFYSSQYDYLITEIDDLNQRSMAAHAKVGFENIHSYRSECGKDWNLVLWDWT